MKRTSFALGKSTSFAPMKLLSLALGMTLSLSSHAWAQGTENGLNAADAIVSDPRPILVIVGLNQEASIAAGKGVETIVSGSNIIQLTKALQKVTPSRFKAVISFGIAGGLNPSFHTGQLVIAKHVIASQQSWETSPALQSWIANRLEKQGLTINQGIEVGVNVFDAVDPASKLALRRSSGADAVDMESQIAAAFAAANHLPFVVIRAVSDTASTTVPPAAQVPLTTDGDIDYGAVFGNIIGNPSQIGELEKLREGTNAAYASLTTSRKALIQLLGKAP